METIKEILLALVAAGVCGIGAYLLKQYRQNILTLITNLVQKAEEAVQGSGMGSEKKALVLAQLEAAGIKVKTWMSTAIDTIVATLNEKSAWFVTQAKEVTESEEA
jgi:hypothetical protein